MDFDVNSFADPRAHAWRGKCSKALGLPRVSTKGQKHGIDESGIQLKAFRQYCLDNNLDLVKVFPIAESAKDSGSRTQFHMAIQYALDNGIRHILFYLDDRESRNLTDVESNEKLVLQDKIVLHFVLERQILHSKSPDSDFQMRDYKAVNNKHFSRRLRTRVIETQKDKAERGWYPGPQPPWPYIPVPERDEHGNEIKRRSIIGIDKDLVPLVLREFELRGYKKLSFECIRQQIIAEGFIPADKIANYRASAIEKRLSNDFYYGYFSWNGVSYQGKHELFIPAKLRDLVKQSLGTWGGQPRETLPQEGVFAGGWLKCAHPDCGCHIIYDPKIKKHRKTGEYRRTFHYYRCSNGKRIHKTQAGMNITVDKIWEQFGETVDSIVISPKLAQQIADALNKTHHKASAAKKAEIKAYRDGLALLEGQEDLHYDNFCRGIIDQAGYERQIKKVRQERKRFTDLLEQANTSIDGAYLETAKSIIELCINAKSMWKSKSDAEKRDFLDKLLSNPRLNGQVVEYTLKKPFEFLKNAKNVGWQARRDSNPQHADLESAALPIGATGLQISHIDRSRS